MMRKFAINSYKIKKEGKTPAESFWKRRAKKE